MEIKTRPNEVILNCDRVEFNEEQKCLPKKYGEELTNRFDVRERGNIFENCFIKRKKQCYSQESQLFVIFVFEYDDLRTLICDVACLLTCLRMSIGFDDDFLFPLSPRAVCCSPALVCPQVALQTGK